MASEFSPSPLSVLCLQDSVLGHNSEEDARAAMELYRFSRRIESSESCPRSGMKHLLYTPPQALRLFRKKSLLLL